MTEREKNQMVLVGILLIAALVLALFWFKVITLSVNPESIETRINYNELGMSGETLRSFRCGSSGPNLDSVFVITSGAINPISTFTDNSYIRIKVTQNNANPNIPIGRIVGTATGSGINIQYATINNGGEFVDGYAVFAPGSSLNSDDFCRTEFNLIPAATTTTTLPNICDIEGSRKCELSNNQPAIFDCVNSQWQIRDFVTTCNLECLTNDQCSQGFVCDVDGDWNCIPESMTTTTTIDVCIAQISCDEWGSCIGNTQERVCFDGCGESTVESRSCNQASTTIPVFETKWVIIDGQCVEVLSDFASDREFSSSQVCMKELKGEQNMFIIIGFVVLLVIVLVSIFIWRMRK